MSNSSIVYGVVIANKFYSNRMEFFTKKRMANGIYSIDMECDDFKNQLSPANVDDAIKFFRKASNLKVFRGISFRDGIIPENPVAFKEIPLKVIDATYDDFEEVEVVSLLNGSNYFLRNVTTNKAYALMDVKAALDSDAKIDALKGIPPEIRILYMFHVLEKIEQKRLELEEKRKLLAQEEAKRLLEPVAAIRNAMESSGATVRSVKKVNRGFEVVWQQDGHTINTLLDTHYKVISAGFCVSGYDDTQSARSVVNLLKDYVRQGDHIHLTRTAN